MNAVAAPEKPQVQSEVSEPAKKQVIALMGEVLMRGESMEVATATAWSHVLDKNLVGELFRECATEFLSTLWKQSAHERRNVAAGGGFIGTRRVNVGSLNAATEIYGTPYCVNGTWKGIGDLTRTDLDWLAGDRTSRASTLQSQAAMWREMAKRLKKETDTVKAKFSADELAALLKQAGER